MVTTLEEVKERSCGLEATQKGAGGISMLTSFLPILKLIVLLIGLIQLGICGQGNLLYIT